jgi:hypothetical protein
MLPFLLYEANRPKTPVNPFQRKVQFNLSHLTIKIASNSTLQLSSTLTQDLGQVVQIITSRDTKLPDEILSCRLEITVVFSSINLVRSAEICVGGNRGGTLETLKTILRFCFGVGVEVALSEEFVRSDTLLVAKFLARVFFIIVYLILVSLLLKLI